MSLEVLHLTLMLLGSGACLERAQISSSLGLRVEFPRVQPIFARAEFSYHSFPRGQPDLRLVADLFLGTFLPARRASDKPIAMVLSALDLGARAAALQGTALALMHGFCHFF